MMNAIKLLMIALFIFFLLNNSRAGNTVTGEDAWDSNGVTVEQMHETASTR